MFLGAVGLLGASAIFWMSNVFITYFSPCFLSLSLYLSLSFAFPRTSPKIPFHQRTRRPLLIARPPFLAASRALSYHSRSNFVNDLAWFANLSPPHRDSSSFILCFRRCVLFLFLMPNLFPMSRLCRIQKSLNSDWYSDSSWVPYRSSETRVQVSMTNIVASRR